MEDEIGFNEEYREELNENIRKMNDAATEVYDSYEPGTSKNALDSAKKQFEASESKVLGTIVDGLGIEEYFDSSDLKNLIDAKKSNNLFDKTGLTADELKASERLEKFMTESEGAQKMKEMVSQAIKEALDVGEIDPDKTLTESEKKSIISKIKDFFRDHPGLASFIIKGIFIAGTIGAIFAFLAKPILCSIAEAESGCYQMNQKTDVFEIYETCPQKDLCETCSTTVKSGAFERCNSCIIKNKCSSEDCDWKGQVRCVSSTEIFGQITKGLANLPKDIGGAIGWLMKHGKTILIIIGVIFGLIIIGILIEIVRPLL